MIDIMATCLDVAGEEYPTEFHGRKPLPMEGKSLLPIFQGRQRKGMKCCAGACRSITSSAWADGKRFAQEAAERGSSSISKRTAPRRSTWQNASPSGRKNLRLGLKQWRKRVGARMMKWHRRGVLTRSSLHIRNPKDPNMPSPRNQKGIDGATTRRTMRSLYLLLLVVSLPLPAAAQSLERTDRGYLWRHGNEYVRFDRGRWSAGIEGKAEFGWHMFLWHDDWIYETLPGGNIETSPALTDDGSLTMRGRSRREIARRQSSMPSGLHPPTRAFGYVANYRRVRP